MLPPSGVLGKCARLLVHASVATIGAEKQSRLGQGSFIHSMCSLVTQLVIQPTATVVPVDLSPVSRILETPTCQVMQDPRMKMQLHRCVRKSPECRHRDVLARAPGVKKRHKCMQKVPGWNTHTRQFKSPASRGTSISDSLHAGDLDHMMIARGVVVGIG